MVFDRCYYIQRGCLTLEVDLNKVDMGWETGLCLETLEEMWLTSAEVFFAQYLEEVKKW